eukprot:Gregarina_sp_Pseudo_9__1449@NODE_1973_length_1225_cov_10_136594_g1827_i0_p1_GENE_NODE_1973_length_1225_cov_10_136594_g1827_i0NODE_1973_length_1225_cov_10_136594_g1827_i0_p1_ORF_typecomplete_len369_score80_67Peptidase_C97/PF05903_14/2_3e29LRAT/PF04970_13/0_34_NODE_1973_length_1225_cov_10_136594_g1827_i0261132
MPEPVCLRIYDLSGGHAAALSKILIGRKFRGVWHCGIAVFGYEYFYGGYIGKLPPQAVEREIQMSPYKVELLGETNVTASEFGRFLRDIDDRFTPETYHLMEWNCNHFADVCSRFLLNGRGIPASILKQPQKIQTCWRGKLILGLVRSLTGNPFVDRELLLGTTHPINAEHRASQTAEESKSWLAKAVDFYSNLANMCSMQEDDEDDNPAVPLSADEDNNDSIPVSSTPSTSASLNSGRGGGAPLKFSAAPSSGSLLQLTRRRRLSQLGPDSARSVSLASPLLPSRLLPPAETASPASLRASTPTWSRRRDGVSPRAPMWPHRGDGVSPPTSPLFQLSKKKLLLEPGPPAYRRRSSVRPSPSSRLGMC